MRTGRRRPFSMRASPTKSWSCRAPTIVPSSNRSRRAPSHVGQHDRLAVTQVGRPRLPSRPAPGCRPAPSRSAADARKRPDYAQGSVAKSSEIAWASVNRPTASRRSAAIWPSVPSASREVAGERADIGALRRPRPRNRRDRGSGRAMRRSSAISTGRAASRGGLAGARQRIGAAAGDLDRRIGRRALQDRAGEARQRRCDRRRVRAHRRSRRRPRPRCRRCRWRCPSGSGSGSACVAFDDEADGLGRLAERDRQHAGRQRVERAGMPGLRRRWRAAPRRPRALEVIPAGLSMTSQPWRPRSPLVIAFGVACRSRSTSALCEQRGDARGAVEGVVEREGEVRAPGAAATVRADAALEKRRAALQRRP